MNPQSKRSGTSPLGVGVISIVTVLLVLCLTIFSALTLTTAKADLNLSRINADTVSAWYAADAEAARQYAAFAASPSPGGSPSTSTWSGTGTAACGCWPGAP